MCVWCVCVCLRCGCVHFVTFPKGTSSALPLPVILFFLPFAGETDLLTVCDAGRGGKGFFENVNSLRWVDVLASGAHHQTKQQAQLFHEPQVTPFLNVKCSKKQTTRSASTDFRETFSLLRHYGNAAKNDLRRSDLH